MMIRRRKRPKIQERLKKVEECLRNAEQYVARDVNVESTSFCHFAEWKGKSGHPLWMKNYAIPAMKRALARFERDSTGSPRGRKTGGRRAADRGRTRKVVDVT